MQKVATRCRIGAERCPFTAKNRFRAQQINSRQNGANDDPQVGEEHSKRTPIRGRTQQRNPNSRQNAANKVARAAARATGAAALVTRGPLLIRSQPNARARSRALFDAEHSKLAALRGGTQHSDAERSKMAQKQC